MRKSDYEALIVTMKINVEKKRGIPQSKIGILDNRGCLLKVGWKGKREKDIEDVIPPPPKDYGLVMIFNILGSSSKMLAFKIKIK